MLSGQSQRKCGNRLDPAHRQERTGQRASNTSSTSGVNIISHVRGPATRPPGAESRAGRALVLPRRGPYLGRRRLSRPPGWRWSGRAIPSSDCEHTSRVPPDGDSLTRPHELRCHPRHRLPLRCRASVLPPELSALREEQAPSNKNKGGPHGRFPCCLILVALTTTQAPGSTVAASSSFIRSPAMKG